MGVCIWVAAGGFQRTVSAFDTGRCANGLLLLTTVRRLGQGVFFAVLGVCFLVLIAVGVVEARDAGVDEPALWGTFVEQVCEPKLHGGCSSIGTWTSDDGGVAKSGVRLDGTVGDDGTVRARFQPGGWGSDEERNVVHAAEWASAALWLPWVGAAGVAAVVAYYARRWRHPRKRSEATTSGDEQPARTTAIAAVVGDDLVDVRIGIAHC